MSAAKFHVGQLVIVINGRDVPALVGRIGPIVKLSPGARGMGMDPRGHTYVDDYDVLVDLGVPGFDGQALPWAFHFCDIIPIEDPDQAVVTHQEETLEEPA